MSARLERARNERLLVLLREQARRLPPWKPLPGPQTMAYESEADIIGFGGSAGGGKTDLACGKATTKHKRGLVLRKEKAQTEGIIQRLSEICGGTTTGYNSQKSAWKVPIGSRPLIEFGGLDNPGDEARWQGRGHDFKVFDEVTEMREDQVRFVMGWTRSSDPSVHPQVLMTFNPPTTAEGRWVIAFFAPWLDKKHPNPAQPGELRWFTTIAGKDREVTDRRPFVLIDGEPVYEFDPKDHKAENVIVPKSRTFIPARVTDNPYYMGTGYMAQLQALPEPLRSQMLYGDFMAGVQDNAFQVIPTAWVELAQARWKRPDRLPPMDSMGIDVARGGKDNTIIARRHDMWFDEALTYPGTETPNGPVVAGLVIAAARDNAPEHIDVIGVGASPYDFLHSIGQPVYGINVSEKAQGTDRSGRMRFLNLRAELWWKMREALDPANNTGIALPPDPRLLGDLCAPIWWTQGAVIQVEGRDDIQKRIGRSPDWASAYILALIDTPKLRRDSALTHGTDREYDPYSAI